MKIAVFCLIIITALLNFSCGQNVKSSAITVNEKITELPKQTPTPDQYKSLDIMQHYPDSDESETPFLAEYQDYKIKKVAIKKTDREESEPKVDIYDAVLSKNGKTIAKFEGDFYPLGNEVSFGFYSFLNNSDKQLLVFDESYKYERDWIVSLSPKYEVIFDSKDYNILWGRLEAVDLDNDGVFELIESNDPQTDLGLSNMYTPWMTVVFKYDAKTHKYLPANHKFTTYILENIEEDVNSFKWENDRAITELVEIMFRYIYTGNEETAWKFYDEKMNSGAPDKSPANFPGKEKFKERLVNAFNKDPIYKFIKTDLQKKK